MTGYVYDSGVLIGAERNDRFVWALHKRLLEQASRPVVPSTVLAQAWRGGPQAQLSRFLKGCEIRPFTDSDARQAGHLLGRNRTCDIVDASVVVVGQSRGCTILTSDPDDLRLLAAALGRSRVEIRDLNDLTRL